MSTVTPVSFSPEDITTVRILCGTCNQETTYDFDLAGKGAPANCSFCNATKAEERTPM